MYELIDKIMPQDGENPRDLQVKIDDFLSVNPNADERAFNEILAAIEMEGFRKGVRAGWQLNEESRL